MKEDPKKTKEVFEGIVMSNRMQKTLVVKINRVKVHPKYHKRFVMSTKYKVHVSDEKKYTIGQTVNFVETRPLSKDKRWKVVETKE